MWRANGVIHAGEAEQRCAWGVTVLVVVAVVERKVTMTEAVAGEMKKREERVGER